MNIEMPTLRIQTILATALLLGGCQSIEGRYEPACAAFEGDTIELSDGRFTWNRFTDEVRIDAAGNKIDPFPDFPKHGRYERDGAQIALHVDDDTTRATYASHSQAGETYLLTSSQLDKYLYDGVVEDCALKRVGTAKK